MHTHTRRYTTVYFYRTKYLHILAYSVIVFIVTHLSHAYTRETVTSARENPLRARAPRGDRAPGTGGAASHTKAAGRPAVEADGTRICFWCNRKCWETWKTCKARARGIPQVLV